MKFILKKHFCPCDFEHDSASLVIAKDDFPLETFKNRPIINYIRKVLHASHIEGHVCYETRKGIKVERKAATD